MPVNSQALISSAKVAQQNATCEADWRGVCARAYYAIYQDGKAFHELLPMPGSLAPGSKGGLHENLFQQLQNPTIPKSDGLYARSKQIGYLMASLHAMRVKADYLRDSSLTKEDSENSLAQLATLSQKLFQLAPIASPPASSTDSLSALSSAPQPQQPHSDAPPTKNGRPTLTRIR